MNELISWRQSKVPFAMKLVSFQDQSGEFLVGHLDAFLVGNLVDILIRLDYEPASSVSFAGRGLAI